MRSPCAGREFNYRPVQGNTVMAAHANTPSAAITRPAFVRCQRGGKITAAQKEAFMKEKLARQHDPGDRTDFSTGRKERLSHWA